MNRMLALGAVAAAILVTACSRDEAGNDADNPFLAYVPADAAYVLANLEPAPAEVVDAWLQRAQPLMDELQESLVTVREDLEADQVDIDSEDMKAVMLAVLDELDGKFNRAGLESLGITLEQRHVVYAAGLLPMARFSLGDAEALRAAIGRIEASSGVPIPERQHDGRAYWRMADEDAGFAAYIAILDDHVAMGLSPIAREAEWLPALLGRERPAESMIDSHALSSLNEAKDYTAYGSGFIDLDRVIDELFSADSETTALLRQLGRPGLADLDPSCEREARLVAHFAPRVVMGTTELTTDTVGVRYQVELERGLAGELANLLADVPPASGDDGLLGSASLNLSVGALREWLLKTGNTLAANPFRCPQLAGINDAIATASAQLNQPMPPFVGNFKGLRAELASADLRDFDAGRMSGLFAVEMESPQMVIGMAKMMVPGFENLEIEPGSEPVQVPQELMSVVTPEFSVYAMMSRDAIGLSFGPDQQDRLEPFLEADDDHGDIVFSAEYDMAALATLQTRQNDAGMNAQADGDTAHDLLEAYQAMLGRTRVEVLLDGEGITIDNRQTFR